MTGTEASSVSEGTHLIPSFVQASCSDGFCFSSGGAKRKRERGRLLLSNRERSSPSIVAIAPPSLRVPQNPPARKRRGQFLSLLCVFRIATSRWLASGRKKMDGEGGGIETRTKADRPATTRRRIFSPESTAYSRRPSLNLFSVLRGQAIVCASSNK